MVATISPAQANGLSKGRGTIRLAVSQRFINWLTENGKADLFTDIKAEYDEYKKFAAASDYWSSKSATDIANAIAKHEAAIAKARAALAKR